ncbi:MAG: pyridoxamine 5'-phosphate oxidase family protein, partial [Thermodesulfobacteriota bacterium]|nr:pyridoxamine 5'-phosphate oxidase family protein [Thermodesulfobacteriota bacterium]
MENKGIKLPKEVVEVLQDPETIKVLTTKDGEGVPHTVFKGSLTALDDKTIAYMELLENSHTLKNILRLMNIESGKKLVAINVLDQKKGISYQIKGEPYQLHIEGP